MQGSQTSRMKILGTHTSAHASVGIRRVTRAPDFSVYGRALVPRLPRARIYVCIYIRKCAPWKLLECETLALPIDPRGDVTGRGSELA